MTPDGANIEKDRLVLPLRFLKRLFAVFIPPDRLIRGTAQIRALRMINRFAAVRIPHTSPYLTP